MRKNTSGLDGDHVLSAISVEVSDRDRHVIAERPVRVSVEIAGG
jgi:hypothetical protein